MLTGALAWAQSQPIAAGVIALAVAAFFYFKPKPALKLLLLVVGLWLAYELVMLIIALTSDSLDQTNKLKGRRDVDVN